MSVLEHEEVLVRRGSRSGLTPHQAAAQLARRRVADAAVRRA